MNFIGGMNQRVIQYYLNLNKSPSAKPGIIPFENWRIIIERRFLDETDEKGYWSFRLTHLLRGQVFFKTKQLTLEGCFLSAGQLPDGFPEIDMSWLTEIAGLLARLEKFGSKLVIAHFDNGGERALELTALCNRKRWQYPRYVYRASLLRDEEHTPERLWGNLIGMVSDNFPVAVSK